MKDEIIIKQKLAQLQKKRKAITDQVDTNK